MYRMEASTCSRASCNAARPAGDWTSAARVAQLDLSHGQDLANLFVEFGGQAAAFPLLRQRDFRRQGPQPRLVVEAMRFHAVVQPAPQRRPRRRRLTAKNRVRGQAWWEKLWRIAWVSRQGGLRGQNTHAGGGPP